VYEVMWLVRHEELLCERVLNKILMVFERLWLMRFEVDKEQER
jgi:hypothetical protein